MNKQYTIRKGEETDLEILQDLFVTSIKNTCTDDYSPAEITAWTRSVENKERWSKKIREQEFFLAFEDNRLAGFVSLADGQYIDFLYSHPDQQGKGLASLLINTVESRAKELGNSTISSDISITALPFIKHKGYQVIMENKNPFYGEVLINYRVTKELSS